MIPSKPCTLCGLTKPLDQGRHFATHANDEPMPLPPHRLVKVNRGDIEDVLFAIDEDDYDTYVKNRAAPWLYLNPTHETCKPGNSNGPRKIETSDEKKRKTYIHRLIMSAEIKREAQRRGCEPARIVVDHINGDTLDNRRANLRAVTQRQNLLSPQRKKTTQRQTTSDQVGVYYNKAVKRWYARIMKENTAPQQDSFKTEEEAKKWLKAERAKLVREIGMDTEPPARLPELVEVHARIDAWYRTNATGESEEVRARRLAKKTEYNQGLKQQLRDDRTRQLADVTAQLTKDPNNIELIDKKRKLERAESASKSRTTGQKLTREEKQKNMNEGRNIRAAAKRANERERLENAEQTDEVKGQLKRLETRELKSKSRLEGKQVDQNQKWRQKAEAERRAKFDALMAEEGANELLHQYNILLPVDRLDMVDRKPYAYTLDNVQRTLKRHIEQTHKESDVALLEFIVRLEKIMTSEAISKAKTKGGVQSSVVSTYSAEADLENANREMDEFLAQNQALYDEYNAMCRVTRRDHLVLNGTPAGSKIGAAKRKVEAMRRSGERPDLVEFMDEIEWRMDRLQQCTERVAKSNKQ